MIGWLRKRWNRWYQEWQRLNREFNEFEQAIAIAPNETVSPDDARALLDALCFTLEVFAEFDEPRIYTRASLLLDRVRKARYHIVEVDYINELPPRVPAPPCSSCGAPSRHTIVGGGSGAGRFRRIGITAACWQRQSFAYRARRPRNALVI